MVMHVAAVRCPNCDRRVQVQPAVSSVRSDGPRLTVEFAVVTVTHHCGEPPNPVGFAPAREGGDT